MKLGKVYQPLGEPAGLVAQLNRVLPHPKAQRRLDLVVSAPSCMDFLACLAHLFGQIGFDGGVTILVLLGNRESILTAEFDDLGQGLFQAGEFFIVE